MTINKNHQHPQGGEFMLSTTFLEMGEYGAAGMYEEQDRSLFYRKALGIRRFYENRELAEYQGEDLYPNGPIFTAMQIKPNYMEGMCIDYNGVAARNKEAADCFVKDFGKYNRSIPYPHTVSGCMYNHSMPNYERILKEGFLSYIDRIEKMEDPDMREGLLHIIEGIKIYLDRSIAYLESAGAKPQLIAALKKVPMHPAETLYEALVCWNFVLYLDNCDNLGCLAAGLAPYYKGEDVTDVIRNLYNNLDSNNGYSMSLPATSDPVINALTLQCLEAAKGKRRPMIELFVDESTPDAVWDKAFEVIRTGGGQPAFYNPKVLLEGLKKKFPTITDEDVNKFCGGGCTEAMLAGLSCVGSIDAGINLPYIFEQVMHEQLPEADSFEDFYNRFIAEVKKTVELVTDSISNMQLLRAKHNPVPMRTLLIDDCIDRGVEYNNGGARYTWSIINMAGMINIIDSMLVIRDLVFRNKTLTAKELLEKLNANDTDFLKHARNHCVSFGNDNADANNFSTKISEEIFSMLDDKKPAIGQGFLPASIQFQSQVDAGRIVGATPDGREKGAPLCDSMSAIFGKDINGPTALLKSVTSLDIKRLLGVAVLNFNINPSFSNDIFKALIQTYMELGGMQMQITCISKETLEEAYQNPDLYKNLVVRVGGYSEYFHRLSDELKRMVIDRSIQNEV